MEITLHYVDAKLGIVERSKKVALDNDADMAELTRFVKSTIPKVRAAHQCNSIVYFNIRTAKSVPAEYSLNAYVVDVLRPGREYFAVYEKEQLAWEDKDYKEITKYLFFESGKDWVK